MELELYAHPHFSIHNIPFGIFRPAGESFRVGVAIGDYVLDLAKWSALIKEKHTHLYNKETLNEFVAMGKSYTNKIRSMIQQWLLENKESYNEIINLFYRQKDVRMSLPFQIGDYTDFYSSKDHARNVGEMFRGKGNALLPNWLHLPVAYHGRASSIVISGTPIRRPIGQVVPENDSTPSLKATEKLDFEVEMGLIIGKNSELGNRIFVDEAEEYIFGMVMVNDWSARDIQKWEYVPLGPFLGKNFATAISPWVVTIEALEPYITSRPTQEPQPLPYLRGSSSFHFDIEIETVLETDSGETSISTTNTKFLYWDMLQQITHHTVNGCNVRIGDLMASGTISGSQQDSYGSMLELSWNGERPIRLSDGSLRSFLHDYDQIRMVGMATNGRNSIGFGSLHNRIEPAAL